MNDEDRKKYQEAYEKLAKKLKEEHDQKNIEDRAEEGHGQDDTN